jgi:hypothetical protein
MVKLLKHNLRQAESVRRCLNILLPEGTTVEDLLNPSAWSHVAHEVTAGDRIEVKTGDGSEFADLYIRSVSVLGVHAAILAHYRFNTDEKRTPAMAAGEFTVKWRGAAGWSVLRSDDNKVMFEGGKSRGDADRWLATQLELV